MLPGISLNPSYTGIWLRGQQLDWYEAEREMCLNPSYTGIWLRGFAGDELKHSRNLRLNPSYTGIWLRGRTYVVRNCQRDLVLTLLILEFGFGAVCS